MGVLPPGDAAGFPVTISEVGSYRLTGNLSIGSTDAIEITADNVTLDLNGFLIIGPECGPDQDHLSNKPKCRRVLLLL